MKIVIINKTEMCNHARTKIKMVIYVEVNINKEIVKKKTGGKNFQKPAVHTFISH